MSKQKNNTNSKKLNNTEPKHPPIAREGYPFIFILLGLGLVFMAFSLQYISWLCLFLAAFVVYFFRDPSRKIPDAKGAVVSPADGRIIGINQVNLPGFDKPFTQVNIFLSIFNVHINRCPLGAIVKKVDYKEGKFKAAYAKEASTQNEHTAILFEAGNMPIIVKQIAGLIARRIICKIKAGDKVDKGQRFGLISFGSRVEIFIPADSADIKVKQGDKVKGGESLIAVVK